jgi:pimeloyl-ACP methyl ester carboxylesterase
VKKFIFDYIRGIRENDPCTHIPFRRALVPLDGEGEYLYCAATVPAGAGGGTNRAVIVCPPFLEERILSHRLLNRLQKRLTLEGYTTVRFDYHGTGDSSGDVSGVTLESMNRDLERIVGYTRETYGPERITMLGVRLGGTVVMDSVLPDADSALLWSPVVSTRRYIQELYKLQILSDTTSGLAAKDSDYYTGRVERGEPVEILGYAIGAEFVQQCLRRTSMPTAPAFARIDLFRLGTRQTHVYREELDRLVENMARAGHRVIDSELRCPPSWSDGLHMWEEIPELFEETITCLAQL